MFVKSVVKYRQEDYMATYEWMGKQATREQIKDWIEWKRGELKIEEKLRGRGTNFYQTNLEAIKEAEKLISEGVNYELRRNTEIKTRNGF